MLNPLWVRLDKVVHEEFGIERLFLVSRGKQLAIANFLGPDEKASFAAGARQRAERGQTRGDQDDVQLVQESGGCGRANPP